MKRILFCLIALALAGCISKGPKTNPEVSKPEWKTTCEDLHSAAEWKFCYHAKGNPKQTLFYFHGMAESQLAFVNPNFGAESKSEIMSKVNDIAIIVVSVDPKTIAGRTIAAWSLTPYRPREKGDPTATVQDFYEHVLPELEKRFTLSYPYYALGHSMGGWNVAQLCMHDTGIFKKCVMSNPMIPNYANPYSLAAKFTCPACWDVIIEFEKSRWPEIDPLSQISSKTVVTRLPPTLIAACKTDTFKLYGGPKRFYEIAKQRGFDVTFLDAPKGCNHYTQQVDKILNFLELRQ